MTAEERAHEIIGCLGRAKAELERAAMLIAGRPRGMDERETRRWVIGTIHRHSITGLWLKAREAHKRMRRHWSERPSERGCPEEK